MRESGYFPAGAEFDPSAPYNEPVVPEKDFDVTCSQSLSKTVTVTTDNYIPGASGVDYEPDDEGGCCAYSWQDEDNTEDTNWADEFHENDYHTPLQLIELFKQCLEQQLSHGVVFKSPRYTEKLIKECSDWSEDETVFMKEDD